MQMVNGRRAARVQPAARRLTSCGGPGPGVAVFRVVP